MEQVEVWRGRHGDPVPLFGPLPGVRSGDVLAYEFQLPAQYIPWPGGTLLERTFVLLDLGVSMALPAWRANAAVSREDSGPGTWYVDLVHVTARPGSVIVRDLYIDVMVPTDGRHQRLLDLDEYADAMEAGQLDAAVAVDGLRRWQRFLDRHLHAARDPQDGWTDFPPQRLGELAALPAPLGPVVTAPG
jgi:hypothetical protein